MRASRPIRSLAASAAILLTAGVLAACGSSDGDSGATGGDAAAASAPAEAEGAMADPTFAVTTYLDTMWPIEGNPYADAASAEGWCATFETDQAGAIAAVQEYLADEPDIMAADPAAVETAISDYLTNNCEYIAG